MDRFYPEPYLGQPVASLQQMLRTIATLDPAIPRIIPDGLYGKSTRQAVAAFQRRYGLPVTGVAEEVTWQTIAAVHEDAHREVSGATPLHIYIGPGQAIDRDSPHVYLLQGMLRTISQVYAGLPPVALTGVYDDDTRLLVRYLQERSDHPAPSGVVDKRTWELLTHLYRTSTTPEQ